MQRMKREHGAKTIEEMMDEISHTQKAKQLKAIEEIQELETKAKDRMSSFDPDAKAAKMRKKALKALNNENI